MSTVIQYILYLAVLVALAIPLGAYIKKVMNGEKTFLSKILTPCENAVYKVLRVNKEEQMNWKKYTVSVLAFSGVGLLFLFLLQLLQGVLPGNPQGLPGVKWDLSFNTAVSFVTNTNWQAYSGESTLSYLTQALGLTVQNFVSAASEEYKALVAERVEKLRKANPEMDETAIPVDLVTCSGSGLDPHISPAAAKYQTARIAKANHMTEDEVEKIIDECTDGRFLGIFGEETVNVLKVNLMLDGIL